MEARVPRWQTDLLPPVLHAHFNATTTSGDSRLIIVSLFVAGARRPLRALLDSGTTNNFFRASCLSILLAGVPVRDLPGDVIVKLMDGKPRRLARRELSLPYTFDGFHSNDNFIVFEMNCAFDCILGIPWLVGYQPQIDWLARSAKRHQDFDVTEVFTHLLVAPKDWPHVTVVDGASTTHVVRRASDGLLCTTCAVLLTGDEDEEPARGRASERRAVEHPWLPRMKNETVEQLFPHANEAVEQRLPHANEAVEQGLPHDDAAVEQELPPRANGAVENELSRQEEGEASSSESDTSVSSRGSRQRFAAQSWESLKASGNPIYETARELADVFPDKIPAEPSTDRDVRHEIDLTPGSKYCVTRQWPLPRDQAKAIDDFFEGRRQAGHVRESISPHSSPTFCVKKATGGWRIVDAFNKLNDATIPAQTRIPRKDMVLDSMSGSVIYSAIDLTDGFYQILMRESDIPLTAVSTPSGMLWEWLVMPQGLNNAPATFNRMVSHVFRPLRDFAPSYFDDIFVHSRAEGDLSAVEVHVRHLRQVFQVMRENKLYANLKNPTEIRQWLGLANYLHKYTKDYAGLIQPLSSLLKKDATWLWRPEHQAAFDSVKKSLASAPILMLPDDSKSFHVVCDASDFAIGCALMQFDDEGRERVVSYQSLQMKPAERNYPVHDKELLAMRYALIKFRVYLLGEQTFAVYTGHASLRTAMKSPHLSQRMARWLSFVAEYNFVVHYKPGKNNILADALSRRPDYDPRTVLRRQVIDDEDENDDHCAVCLASGINLTNVSPEMDLRDEIVAAYADDAIYADIVAYLRAPSDKTLGALSRITRNQIDRYHLDGDLLCYNIDKFDAPRVVVPNGDDLRARIIHEFHDSPMGAHLGREKTFAAV
ncbi:hypothetical protein PR003_g11886 [Phytophthora rubi]|uniref:Reverse transcriptase domain-containing protein n=1 Tax=Phytophthora rubi TaxID=129364 RepID=A0A6A4FLY6_9STRA|nr:hypothetical protein PR003_g11886 [Phytophthora rubi]